MKLSNCLGEPPEPPAAMNINEKDLRLKKERRGLYNGYLNDKSYENKMNVKKVEKAFKHELRKCEVKAMDKVPEDLEDA